MQDASQLKSLEEDLSKELSVYEVNVQQGIADIEKLANKLPDRDPNLRLLAATKQEG